MKYADSIKVLRKFNALKINAKIALSRVDNIESALKILTPDERAIIDKFFINPTEDPVMDLCEILNYERQMIYRLRQSALEKLEIALFGREISPDGGGD